MHKQKITILILAGLGSIATFLPWITIPIIGSFNGTRSAIGWITLTLFMITIIFTILNDKSKPVKIGLLIVAIIPSILASLIGIWQIVTINNQKSQASNNALEQLAQPFMSIGYGLYLIVLAGIAIPVFAFIMRDSKKLASRTSNDFTFKKAQPIKNQKEINREKEENLNVKENLDKEKDSKIDKEDHSRFMPK